MLNFLLDTVTCANILAAELIRAVSGARQGVYVFRFAAHKRGRGSQCVWLICNTFCYKLYNQLRKIGVSSGGSRIFQMGGRCFVTNGGAHILFSGKKCMKLKEIGLKWGGARLLAPCYSKITIFL